MPESAFVFIPFFLVGWLEEYFVKNKKVSAIAGKVAQVLANWTEGMLRDR